MTHEDVVLFAYRQGIVPEGENTPVKFRKELVHLIGKRYPKCADIGQLAVAQLLRQGAGSAVDELERAMNKPGATGEDVASRAANVPEVSSVNQEIADAEFAAGNLIVGLHQSGRFPDDFLIGLADAMSLQHTLGKDLTRDKRVMLARQAVVYLMTQIERLESAPGEPVPRILKNIVSALYNQDDYLPTLLTKARRVKDGTPARSPQDVEKRYHKDLRAMTEGVRTILLPGDTEAN